jgi:hypothetical protein
MLQSSPESIRSFLVWVLGGVLILGGAAYLVINMGLIPYTGSPLPVAAAGISLISLPFMGRWLTKRENWALVTAWVFLALSGSVLVLYVSPAQQLVVVFMLAALLVPLIVAYFADRQRWWLWIPVYLLVLAGSYVTLTALNLELEVMVSAAIFAVAVPFWGMLVLSQSARWAIIPAAILTIAAGLVLLFFSVLQPNTMAYFVVLNGVLAAAMLGLWVAARRFDWAMWLAAAFAGAAVLSIRFPGPTNWALVALVIGGYLIYKQIGAGRKALPSTTAAAAPQTSQPAAPAVQSQPATPISAVPAVTPLTAPKGLPPGVEFIPLDPLKGRKSDD